MSSLGTSTIHDEEPLCGPLIRGYQPQLCASGTVSTQYPGQTALRAQRAKPIPLLTQSKVHQLGFTRRAEGGGSCEGFTARRP